VESGNHIIRQRREKCRGNFEGAFGQTDRTRAGAFRRQRADFGNRHIALAQQNGFALGQIGQIT
jgi:hypothetical protein